MLVERSIKSSVVKSLNTFPAVGLLGSRQTGKTTLAKQIQAQQKNALYLDLELPSDLTKLDEAEYYLSHHSDRLIIIDEIQRQPELFSLLRALIDQNRKPGRFLILGSASPTLIKQVSETLAGRIIYHRLYPLSIQELGVTAWQKLWLRGGYPPSFFLKTRTSSQQWRTSFLTSLLERDLPQLGINISSVTLRRFLTMTAHLEGQLLNSSSIANNLDISYSTVNRYLDLFEQIYILHRLPPYHTNIKKRLVKSPKIFFVDSGLSHNLLSINSTEHLLSHPNIGRSWESFVINQVKRLLPNQWQLFFYRTSGGAELDLLLVSLDHQTIAVEIKRSLSPTLSPGFYSSMKDIKANQGWVIYPGKESYAIRKNIQAVPITNLPDVLNQL